MNKQIDTSKIMNELKGRSAHFNRSPLPRASNQPAANEDTAVKEQPMTVETTVQEQPIVFKETKKHVSEETSFQVNKETEKQVSKETKKQRNKSPKRYATYLTEESILEMQKIAFETHRKDYEVFQEAVEKYIKRHTG
jgi:hypothetical protein